jgi:hypothetical protein
MRHKYKHIIKHSLQQAVRVCVCVCAKFVLKTMPANKSGHGGYSDLLVVGKEEEDDDVSAA